MARRRVPPAPPSVGYLRLGPPDAGGEEGGHAALLDALGEHTPALEPDPPAGCWLDLRPGARRASGALAVAVLATARSWGYAGARLGVAPTPGVARLAAAHGPANPTLLDPAAVAPFLAPLPVGCLGLDDAPTDRLALVGLRTLGDLAALPRGALGDFLGADGPAVEALARGEDDRPLVPARPPLVLPARRDFDFALADRAHLAAWAARLLAPLLATLRRQGLGATRATLTLRTPGARPVVVAASLRAPTTRPEEVLGPLLAALPGCAGGEEGGDGGVTGLEVALTAPRPLVGRQATFFDVPQGQRGRLRGGVEEARRRGAGHVGYLRPLDPAHPLPERRYALDEGALPDDDRPGAP